MSPELQANDFKKREALGKFDKYKIDLKGMPDSAKYEFVLDNLYFAHIDGPEVQKGKVNVTLTVKELSCFRAEFSDGWNGMGTMRPLSG
ncbi:hypothetical protein KUBF_48790 [Bacteroides finegoldii]|nr:hypothetical protein KUBF_48790 [Bacteroides finegoldii]